MYRSLTVLASRLDSDITVCSNKIDEHSKDKEEDVLKQDRKTEPNQQVLSQKLGPGK